MVSFGLPTPHFVAGPDVERPVSPLLDAVFYVSVLLAAATLGALCGGSRSGLFNGPADCVVVPGAGALLLGPCSEG
jgi:hypothetical protein